jgi:3-oxoacyl-[acyl-carrier protein] reductase
MKDLKNRVDLITGGSRGIGAAVAIAIAKAGANVVVNYRERADAANAVCSEITGIGRKAIAVQADVSVAAAVRRMVAEVEGILEASTSSSTTRLSLIHANRRRLQKRSGTKCSRSI